MKALLKIGGWTFALLGAAWITFTLVAVATRSAGFTTLPVLTGAFVFHAVSNLIGLQLFATAKKRSRSAEGVVAAWRG